MNPAAPVTRMRTAASYASPLVALAVPVSPALSVALSAEPFRVPDLGAIALELPRLLEVLERFVALPELGQSGAEVVVRVRLVQHSAAEERRDGLPGEPLSSRGVVGPEERGRLVGQSLATETRGRRRWRSWRRRSRRGGGGDCAPCARPLVCRRLWAPARG